MFVVNYTATTHQSPVFIVICLVFVMRVSGAAIVFVMRVSGATIVFVWFL